jgi:NAD(P)H-dependent FMN reductase
MEHKDFRILGLAGSLRRASFHRGIVRAAHEVAPEWMSCEGCDLARIPYFFNQHVEDQGNPEPVKELRERIRAYDDVLTATPEYDYAIPGVLTAALDARTASLDLSAQARQQLEAEKVDLGAAEVPEGVSGETAASVEGAVAESCVAGFRVAMVAAVILAVGSAVASVLLTVASVLLIEGKGSAQRTELKTAPA